jgi:hypothetical protein
MKEIDFYILEMKGYYSFSLIGIVSMPVIKALGDSFCGTKLCQHNIVSASLAKRETKGVCMIKIWDFFEHFSLAFMEWTWQIFIISYLSTKKWHHKLHLSYAALSCC